jgi:hypothetical protein
MSRSSNHANIRLPGKVEKAARYVAVNQALHRPAILTIIITMQAG